MGKKKRKMKETVRENSYKATEETTKKANYFRRAEHLFLFLFFASFVWGMWSILSVKTLSADVAAKLIVEIVSALSLTGFAYFLTRMISPENIKCKNLAEHMSLDGALEWWEIRRLMDGNQYLLSLGLIDQRGAIGELACFVNGVVERGYCEKKETRKIFYTLLIPILNPKTMARLSKYEEKLRWKNGEDKVEGLKRILKLK